MRQESENFCKKSSSWFKWPECSQPSEKIRKILILLMVLQHETAAFKVFLGGFAAVLPETPYLFLAQHTGDHLGQVA